jgi:regulator of sirC expression with transglutaminase-like and TPR domain
VDKIEKPAELSDQQLKALISLLDDEDPGALEHVTGRLKQVLIAAPERIEGLIPGLDAAACKRVKELLEDVRWDRLERRFESMARLPDSKFDLEEASYLLATFAYPHLRREEISGPLDAMAKDLHKVLTGRERPLEAVHLVNDFLFELKGFRGNEANYYDPDNTFFNRVLDRKLGIPITLSCLYLFIGKRLALPLAGVGLPGHFIVQFQAPNQRIYLDPFHKGKVLSLSDCQKLMRNQGLEYDRRHLRPIPHRAILARMIANLVNVYADRDDRRRANRLTKLFQLFEET